MKIEDIFYWKVLKTFPYIAFMVSSFRKFKKLDFFFHFSKKTIFVIECVTENDVVFHCTFYILLCQQRLNTTLPDTDSMKKNAFLVHSTPPPFKILPVIFQSAFDGMTYSLKHIRTCAFLNGHYNTYS